MSSKTIIDRAGRVAGLMSAMLLISVALSFAAPLSPDKATVLPAEVSQDWWAETQQQIQGSEYDIQYQEATGVYQSPNRAQNLRFTYYPEGFSVRPRTGEDSWEIKLTLSAYGREGDIPVVYQGGEFMITKNQARVTGNSPIAIEYFNDKKGMRQDFIVDQRLSGNGSLRLELGVKTEGVAYDASKQEVSFVSNVSGGTMVMQYTNLKVTDAEGKELAAYFEKQGDNQLAIVVDDALAQYPIVIDPLSTSPTWTAESNQADTYFGCSVASAGDVNGDGYSDVIIGAHHYDNGENDEGRAFVYHGSSAGLSTSASWTAESDQASALFGFSVASAGDVNGDGYSDVVVGASYYDNGQVNEGRVYAYHGSSAGLATSYAWTSESNQALALFGESVASAGDVNGDGYSDVIIGARGYDKGEDNEGCAFVYHGSSTGLATTATWTAESNQAFSYFGNSVASAGDVNGDGYSDVIIGANYYSNGESNEGCAFVYHGSSTGLATTAAWTGESNQAIAFYGCSVASAGDVNGDGYSDIIVGDYLYHNGEADEGRVFVYQGSSAGLSTTASWISESNQENAFFGMSASSAGDVNGDGYSDVIVGSPAFDNGQDNEGRAFVYYGSSSGLSTTAAWTAESNQAGAYFGISATSAGDINGDGLCDIIVGAYTYDNGQTDEGRAFVYCGSTTGVSGLSTTAAWIGESQQEESGYGVSVASSGDVNGDGYSDVIVGAPWYDNGESNEGRAFVYHGSSSGLSTTAAWTAEGNQADAYFGISVATAGDVNGNGYADIIIGAYGYDNGESNEGRVFVYNGSSYGLSTTATWTAEGNQADAYFGISVATAGDVNGDGYEDVIVGSQYYDNGQVNEGRAYVYHGSNSGLSSSFVWTAERNVTSACFGNSVNTAGDVNGDGYSDVIIGAVGYNNGQPGEGAAFVYHGSSSGLTATSAWSVEGNQNIADYGYSVASAGDVNGDGYSDVIVGEPGYFDGVYYQGRAVVYHGSATGLSATESWSKVGSGAVTGYMPYFGNSVATAGDVNGDGFSDVIVGAYRLHNGGASFAGKAFVYHGARNGLSTLAAWSAGASVGSSEYGRSVASAGDVNGDGYSDVIIGVPHYDNNEINEGGAFVYYGNGGACNKVLPRQFRANQTTPIVPACSNRGGITSTQRAGLSLWGRTFYGRSNVKAQFEVKALGIAFNGSSLNETSWTNVGTAGTNLALLTSNLTQWTLYKWRGRIKYSPTLSVQRYSPWYFLSANAMTECDFRTEGLAQQDERAPQVNIEETSVGKPVMMPLRPYPNPFKSFTTIPGYENKVVVVYDLTGRQAGVYNGSKVGENLTNGIYFVKPLEGIAKPVKLLKVR